MRQGCPLSPLLFAIYLESFCLAIIQNSSIKGFKLMEAEVKLLAYADDVAVCCTTKESITEVTTIVKHFGNTTGSFANWNKCLGFGMVNGSQHRKCSPTLDGLKRQLNTWAFRSNITGGMRTTARRGQTTQGKNNKLERCSSLDVCESYCM